MKRWAPGEGGRLPPPPPSDIAERIAAGWEDLGGPPLQAETFAALGLHLALLYQANLTLNLTGIRDPAQGIRRHALESMEAFLLPRPAPPTALVDLGSGNGYPGLPLLLLWPQARGILVESSPRKAAFLRDTISKLELQGRVTVLESRIENRAEVGEKADFFCLRGFPSPSSWIEALLRRPATREILAWLSAADGLKIAKKLAPSSKTIHAHPIKAADAGVILQLRPSG